MPRTVQGQLLETFPSMPMPIVPTPEPEAPLRKHRMLRLMALFQSPSPWSRTG